MAYLKMSTLSDIFTKIIKIFLDIIVFQNILYKEINISFNHSQQLTTGSPANRSDGFLVYIPKWNGYLCLQLIFGVAKIFTGPSVNLAT